MENGSDLKVGGLLGGLAGGFAGTFVAGITGVVLTFANVVVTLIVGLVADRHLVVGLTTFCIGVVVTLVVMGLIILFAAWYGRRVGRKVEQDADEVEEMAEATTLGLLTSAHTIVHRVR
jgi:hypothetical protein